MGLLSTSVTLYDHSPQLQISALRRNGFTNSITERSGVFEWSRYGKTFLRVWVNSIAGTRKLDFSYSVGLRNYRYQVGFSLVPSNLGRGMVLYFVCPITGKRCRKLYFLEGRFCHRSASHGLYECQTLCKTHRFYVKLFKPEAIGEKYFKMISKKHFRKYYRGKETALYSRMKKAINEI